MDNNKLDFLSPDGCQRIVAHLWYAPGGTTTPTLEDYRLFPVGYETSGTLAEWGRGAISSALIRRGLWFTEQHANKFRLVLLELDSEKVQVYVGDMNIQGFRWLTEEEAKRVAVWRETRPGGF